MDLVKTFKAQKGVYYTNAYARNIFWMIIAFAASHSIFIIFFNLLHVEEMVIYNIFSVLMFLIISLALLTKEYISLPQVDMIITIEFLLHQTFAVYFVGLNGGFQYILFGLATPLVNYALNKQYKMICVIKATSSFIVFVILNILYNFKIQPVYNVENNPVLLVCNIYVICITFYTVSKCSLDSYMRFKQKINSEYEMYKSEVDKQVKVQQNIIGMIANIIEARDEDTGQHTERTSLYVELISKKMKENPKYTEIFTDDYIKKLSSAATLHDIGKLKISDTILNKPGRLTQDEYEIIKTHATEGAKIIRMCEGSIQDKQYLELAYDIALNHHERIDGKGYPAGKKGEEIPLSARIMSVADVYDALTSKRVYKDEYDKDLALNILKEGRDTQFDSDVLDVFFKLIKEKRI